jgi:hypothetical protein
MVDQWYKVHHTPTVTGVYCLSTVAVDHGAASPVALGTAPAASFVQLYVVCTQAPTGPPACTLGDEDDADSHFTYAMLPIAVNAAAIGPVYYYSASKALRATITTAGTAGAWSVKPVIVLGVT